MATFANEVSIEIKESEGFWCDLAKLRACGVRAGLSMRSGAYISSPEDISIEVISRLLSSASVFVQSSDEESKDLALQIAVFTALTSSYSEFHEAVQHILAGLGNFPGLAKIKAYGSELLSFQTYIRNALLAKINTVEVAGKEVALTQFQFDVWNVIDDEKSLAISAPTSAGKSFVVLEYICRCVLSASSIVVVYVAPTRALLSEIQMKLSRQLAAQKNEIRITTIPVVDAEDKPKQIFVLTQERAQIFISSVASAANVNLVVVDEAQSIGDDGRGLILQDVLEKLRELNPGTKFVFLAPGAENMGLVGRSFGVEDSIVKSTALSPVVQNRINVKFNEGDEHRLDLFLVSHGSDEAIGSFVFDRGFALSGEARLAAVAKELGQGGRSLVYATGPSNAESLANLLAVNGDIKLAPSISDLVKFIEQNIHKSYSLANYVRHGVAFHYGNMPSLLKEGIENAFREGGLDYLCCTTTLFQGVNLPAKSVFIDTPSRGNGGEPLDEASLWNFAGRAGRLGEEIIGNVFLVDYDNWQSQPLTFKKPFELKIAFRDVIKEEGDVVLELLRRLSKGNIEIQDAKEFSEKAAAVAGLLLLRASQNNLDVLLRRDVYGIPQNDQNEILEASGQALAKLKLPESVLFSSWMVSPIALTGMHKRIQEKIKKKLFKELIPVNPSYESYSVYNSIVMRMYKYFGGAQLAGEEGRKMRGFVNHVTVVSLQWMRGEPLSKLIGEAVKYRKKMPK
ncbi:DEAD/DEAH box helicase [Azohydromonas lata]|uniref:DEAD/DEAH box helicase n=1 Tax=Azohydromonas lata TaxID=45677 RepID=A0ABU5IDN2_9BURK|nr:DEAD/DEAH box helicase [Azohydromonas lata]MDZ5457225.1 DEAD/DEAH box helicase [Azohydromonas lata]